MTQIKLVAVTFILILFTSITSCTDRGTCATNLSEVCQITIPHRNYIYSKLESQLITSAKEYKRFIQSVDIKEHGGGKKFISSLSAESIDFESSNLLLYFHTENSGSIRVSLESPLPSKNGTEIGMKINRIVSGPPTTDMAYYGYAYIIKREISKITFSSENKVTEIVRKNF